MVRTQRSSSKPLKICPKLYGFCENLVKLSGHSETLGNTLGTTENLGKLYDSVRTWGRP